MWPNTFEDLLIEWTQLRDSCSGLPLPDCLHLVNNWWARAPITNHHLHIADYEDWPLPWDLLADNTFCELAKCLGIVYTLILIEHTEISSLHIKQTDNYYIVSVNNGRFILNDQPNEISGTISESNIGYSIDCEYFKKKIK